MNRARVGVALAALARRAIQVARTWRYLVVVLGVPLAFYILYTVAAVGGRAERLVGGMSWGGYFMVSMAAFGAIGAAVGIGTERPGRWRPFEGGGSGWRWLIGRAAVAMILVMPPVAVVCLAAAVVNGVQLPVGGWLELLVSLWLGALPFVALGLLLGATLDADAAGVTAFGAAIVLAILGGLFQPIESLPSVIVAIAHVLPSYHLAALGWAALAGRGPDPADLLVLAAYTVILGAGLRWRAGGNDTTTRRDG